MSLKNWNNGKNEIYRGIPVECPNCEAQVTVTGYLEEGVLRLEKCPQCGRELALEVRDAGEEEDVPIEMEPSPKVAKAAVNWFLDRAAIPQASAVIGPTNNLITLLANVIHNGVMFFAPGKAVPLHGMLAKFMLEHFVDDDVRIGIIKEMQKDFDKRLAPDGTTPSESETGQNGVLNLDDILNPKTDSTPTDCEETEDDE